ncbi:MAG: hypothetical protein AVDCRST_MAG71-1231 [uncultured Lysobacter sp.]|uniref:diguanylate cyclase n=1 Tax=uncultured Lysobacter sp. TaxID=271060 RepID=A0A6J4L0B4_9GAMM|nr:MAG: hypothetical protein AVDCRST_MAG71-1231 [uncultured Lysobacter sp.]
MSSQPAATEPTDESARQATLDRYAVLDTPPEQAFDDIVRLALTICAVPAAAIALIDRDRVWLKAGTGVDGSEWPREYSMSDAVLRARRLVVVDDVAAALEPSAPALGVTLDGRPLRFYAGAPLIGPEGHVFGVVCVADVSARTLDARQRDGLEVLARQTVHLLELRRYAMEQRTLLRERQAEVERAGRAHAELEVRHEQLLASARRDELTGLLNRAGLAQLLEDPAQMRRLENAGYCLLLLDIDHFKQVNDRHGHLLGDRALRLVADAVHACVREGDLAVRYGGEEFLVVLPNAGLANAAEIAHRIREQVEQVVLPFSLTVSAGIAAGDAALDRPEQVFDRADQALYRAKAGGRNRVVVDDTPRM